MGFLAWFKSNLEEVEASQLELFGSSQALTKYERVDGATVRRDFNQAIKDKGGDTEAQACVHSCHDRRAIWLQTQNTVQGD